MTTLGAINEMLGAIGQAPVAAYDPAPNPDVTAALETLGRNTRQVLLIGWHFNTRYGVTRTADGSTGKISVPGSWYKILPDGQYKGLQCAPRYDPDDLANPTTLYLYDLTNGTYDWRVSGYTTPTFTVVSLLTFDELPRPARNYISAKATVEFVQESLGAPAVDAMMKDRVKEDWAQLLDFETEAGDFNILYGSTSPIAPGLVRYNRFYGL